MSESTPTGETGSAEPRTERVRIIAVEAAVAAGLVPEVSPEPSATPSAEPKAASLPDWTDPPTGQVPRILLDGDAEQAEPVAPTGEFRPFRGPTWREHEHDWSADSLDLSDLVDLAQDEPDRHRAPEEPTVVLEDPTGVPEPRATGRGSAAAPRRDATPSTPGASGGRARIVPTRTSFPTPSPAVTVPRGAADQPDRRQPSAGRSGRNPLLAIATGLVIAALALGMFALGSLATLVLATVVLTAAAAEGYAALRRAGHCPATLLGLLGTPALAVLAYERSSSAFPLVVGALVLCTLIWYLIGVQRTSVVDGLGSTFLIFCWVGVLGSFAGLLLDPTVFPARHGLALFIGAVLCAVAYDIGGYAIGSRFGRHRLARAISPGKTVEGLVGGVVLVLLVAGLGVARIHPWTTPDALGLGVVVAFVAPLGDLVESLVKRDLGLKDMGTILPAHGGLLDRIDTLLFVVPATYFFVRLVHLG